MKQLRAAFVLAFLLHASAHAQEASRDSAATLALAPGDALRIDVWRNKELSCECPIAANGSITHPLYRELKVAGVPLPAVESMLHTFLSRYEANPAFSLTPLLRVIVAGEVRQPNILTVPAGTTVAQAVAMAGGTTDRSELNRVRLIRRGSTIVFDLARADADAPAMELHSGDQVIVPRRRNIMQDVVGPSSSILAALAAVTSVIIQLRR